MGHVPYLDGIGGLAALDACLIVTRLGHFETEAEALTDANNID